MFRMQEKFSLRMKMIRQLRYDLGDENIPVIVGELGSFAKSYKNGVLKYIDIVNDALKSMPQAVRKCGFASSKGLTHRGDDIHFDSPSYRTFGKRYFEVYLNLVK